MHDEINDKNGVRNKREIQKIVGLRQSQTAWFTGINEVAYDTNRTKNLLNSF